MNIKPIPKNERNFNGLDYFLFWSGVAISLAEIWAGGFLAPLGFTLGLAAIFLGHLTGNTFLGLGGLIGSKHGISSMTSVRPSFGLRGANLAAILNIVQLIGWAAVLLIIAGQAGAILGQYIGGVFTSSRLWVLLIGGTTLIWAFYTDMKVWKYLQTVACVLLFAIILLMTFTTFFGLDGITVKNAAPVKSLHFMTAFDLVTAMPISFLPIVADYSRFAKSSKTAFWNTFWGYFFISSWMYILGLAATIHTNSQEPAILILKTLSSTGLAVPALILVVFSTVTSNFPDIYSATCSVMNVSEKVNHKLVMWIVALLTIVVALFFPMAQYQNYLLFVGAMFIPLFGVVISDYLFIRKKKILVSDLYKDKGAYWYRGGYNITAIFAWAAGFAVYLYASFTNSVVGGTVPSFAVAGLLYLAITFRQNKKQSIM